MAYVFAAWKDRKPLASMAKIAASMCFLILAIANGANTTVYGVIILAALAFSWLGDVFLLSLRDGFLMAGIAVFFLAHVAYATAFASRDLNFTVFGATLIFWNAAALLILYWLWKYLHGFYKIAVPVYLAAISVMAALASATLIPLVALGATAFAVSDISVARDRFVERSISNKAWGIPIYYFAQVLIAASVAHQ
jgi:uncharacterized membrane protein YhhN